MNEFTPKYRFELLLPLAFNDGTAAPPETIFGVQQVLIERFGGCRMLPTSPFLGWWREQNHVYEDWTILYIADADRTQENLTWFRQHKEQLKSVHEVTVRRQDFQQVEIYLTVAEILWV